MDRARTELLERAEILARFPEFALLKHRVPFLTKRQNALLLARIARNVERGSCGCILWMGSVNNDGYPRTSLWMPSMRKHYAEYVHRIVLRMATGRELQHWQEASHSCDTPPCVNPKHLKAERRTINRQRSAENTNRKKARAAVRERFARIAA
ncbi:MAG: endonuclease [bacterium]|nr:endonuclease [bacterium]